MAVLDDRRRSSEAEDLLRLLIDTLPAFVWSAGPDGSIEFLNRCGLVYTGFSLDEIQGRNWKAMDIIHPGDVEKMYETWHALVTSGESGEIQARMRRFDGEYRRFVFRVAPLRDNAGHLVAWWAIDVDFKPIKYVGALSDFAPAMKPEERIRQKEREFQQILEAIPALVIVLAPDGRHLHANERTLEYTGVGQEDVVAGDFGERVFHPDDVERPRDERLQLLARGIPFEMEQRILRKDGQYRWFLTRFSPLRDERGDIVRWYAAMTDIHDRKQAEERVQKENIALREEIDKGFMFEEIVGSSPALSEVLSRVAKVAPTDSTVLITGETGTGKELIARAIHKSSQRRGRAFINANCAAIPPSLIASELFGYEKGAFTGALQRHLGRFELAEGGTIFLDEIGELPVETQIALLRVLQEHEFERVGGNRSIRADVRVLAASNRDLQNAIAERTFRTDLFYRLNVFPIEVPPLRERKEDIRLLVEYFIDRYGSQVGKKIRGIDNKSLAVLQSYPWPGNVRELQNVIERSVILTETEILSVDEKWLSVHTQPASASVSKMTVSQERAMLEAALAGSRGRVSGPSGAAVMLGMPPSTLESKIKSLKINKYRFKTD